jgi:hypothetical protein
MNRHDRVLAIVLSPEHLLGLAGVDRIREIVEAAREIVGNRLPCLGPLDEHREIVCSTTERFAQITVLFQTPPALQQFLRGRLILPEVRLGYTLFNGGKLFGETSCVKDSSAGRPRGARDPGTCEAGRRVVEWPYRNAEC